MSSILVNLTGKPVILPLILGTYASPHWLAPEPYPVASGRSATGWLQEWMGAFDGLG
jgi:hypothetical protein